MLSFTERMLGAARLDPATYEEIEADRGATAQAAAVVAVVAVCGAIGNIGHGSHGIIGAVIGAFVGWLIWSAVTYLVGVNLFGGRADMGEMLRTIGFAQAPGVLKILGIVPVFGRLAVLIASLWTLAAVVVALRQALDFDTGRAVVTAIVAWLALIVVGAIVAFFVLGTGLTLGALFG